MIAEEPGLVRRQKLDDAAVGLPERLRAEPVHEVLDRREAVLAGQPGQAALGEVLLARLDDDAGLSLDHLADVVERALLHHPLILVRRGSVTLQMSPMETIWFARPARTTEPGIPHTTELAWSCTITWPPRART